MTALSQSCDHIVQIFSPTEIAGLILCTRQVPCGKDPGYIIPLASGLCRSLSLEAYSLLFLLNLFFIINTSLLLNVHFFFFLWELCIFLKSMHTSNLFFILTNFSFPVSWGNTVCYLLYIITKYACLSESHREVRDWWLNCVTAKNASGSHDWITDLWQRLL